MNVVNIKQVVSKTSLSQSTIYKMIADGEFPKPFALSANRVAWVEQDVDDWLANKAAARLDPSRLPLPAGA